MNTDEALMKLKEEYGSFENFHAEREAISNRHLS
jgi:hypothetical protein